MTRSPTRNWNDGGSVMAMLAMVVWGPGGRVARVQGCGGGGGGF